MTIGHPNATEMAALLKKLEAVTNESTRKLVAESKTNNTIALALRTHKTENGVRVSRYEIVTEKQNIGGIFKNRYSITDITTGRLLYQDLSLFESAMSIVKKLMNNPNNVECDYIAKLDTEYDNLVVESYAYKQRLNHVNDTVRRDVYEAKYSNALRRLKEAKHRILKTL